MDFSLSQGSSLSSPHEPDCHNQNANFDSSFNQSLPVTPNFCNTENNQIYCRSLKILLIHQLLDYSDYAMLVFLFAMGALTISN